MISMLLSILHSKGAILAILARKERKQEFWRTFPPQNTLFAPERSKRAWARNVALANAFLGVLEVIFAKRRKTADF